MNSLQIVPTREEFETIQLIAKTAAESKHFEKLGGFAGIFSIALYAREIGIPPMTALHGGLVHVMGKITMSSEMMGSLIRQKGHKIEILECNEKVCRIKGVRRDTGESYCASYSIEEARKANLVKSGGGYDKHPEDMLFARCMSKLKRRLFPDIATKAYVHGEVPEEEEIEEVQVQKSENIKEIEITSSEGVAKAFSSSHSIEKMSPDHVSELTEILGEDSDLYLKVLNHYEVDGLEKIEDSHFETIKTRAVARKAKREIQ